MRIIWNLCLSVLLIVAAATASAQSYQPGGTRTHCIARSGGATYAILLGGNPWICHQMAIQCTGNPNVQEEFYGAPVILRGPHEICYQDYRPRR